MDDRELEHLFSRFGIVRFAAVVAADGAAGGGRFGVVEMQSEDEAKSAIRVLNGFEIRGVGLTVRWATPPEQTACGHPAMFGPMNSSEESERPAREGGVPDGGATDA